MANNYITTNQTSLSTANGDNTFIAAGVTINYGIDMRGTYNGKSGGDQTVTLYGTLFDSIDDYWGSSSGGDQIFIGATGSVNTYWFGALNLGGSGHLIVNAGTISSMSYGRAITLEGAVAAGHLTERNTITNSGTISSISLHPERTWTDATIYARNTAGTTITNTGSILSSIGYAITFTAGENKVVNSGFIQGGVQFGAGNDFFDSRQGAITGEVISGDGDDILYGSSGDDKLFGGEGNDRLDGYGGADVLIGGGGNDTYIVDNSGDVVDENNATWGGDGNDTVKSSISFDLSDGAQVKGTLETLILTGTGNINGTGTGNSETITGNIGNNLISGGGGNDTLSGGGGNDQLFGETGNDVLLGGSGADTLYGGAGNDTYVFDNAGDVANETGADAGGIDSVFSTVSVNLADAAHVKGQIEKLKLQGGGAISGLGNALNNAITGNAGKNLLDGKQGNDTLEGGAGADRFAFTTALNAASNRDTIKDFVHGSDKLVLENAVFSKLSPGALAAGNFVLNTAKDGNDYLIYNTTTGTLSYDADGNGAGAAVPFVVLTGVPGLTQADFLVV